MADLSSPKELGDALDGWIALGERVGPPCGRRLATGLPRASERICKSVDL